MFSSIGYRLLNEVFGRPINSVTLIDFDKLLDGMRCALVTEFSRSIVATYMKYSYLDDVDGQTGGQNMIWLNESSRES